MSPLALISVGVLIGFPVGWAFCWAGWRRR